MEVVNRIMVIEERQREREREREREGGGTERFIDRERTGGVGVKRENQEMQ